MDGSVRAKQILLTAVKCGMGWVHASNAIVRYYHCYNIRVALTNRCHATDLI